MIKFKSLGAAAILAAAVASPVLAQAVIQEPGAYAFYHPGGDPGMGAGSSGVTGAMASARGGSSSVGAAPNHFARTSGKHYARLGGLMK